MEKTNFYDELYSKKGKAAMRPYWVYDNWFKLLGPVERGQSLLDVGCGTGLLLKAAEHRGLKTFGLELSIEAIKLAAENSPNSEITQGEGEHLPFADSQFDYVCCLGTLEHMSDVPKGLNELVRVGRQTAKFLIVLPNDNYFFWKLKKINKGTAQRDFEELKTLAEWKKMLANAGLEIIGKIRQDKYPSQELKIFAFKNPYKVIRRMMYKFIWLFMPLKYTYQFVFILKKKTQ